MGDTELHEEITRLLKIQDQYTEEEAKKEFNKSWKKCSESIKMVIMAGDELTNRGLKIVADEYSTLLQRRI